MQQTLHATATSAGPETLASFLGRGGTVIAGANLPPVSGMRGAWAELDTGVLDRFPEYTVSAAYEAVNRRVFYELMVVPPPSYSGDCHAGAPRARAIARQLALSFRVEVTDAATAETYR